MAGEELARASSAACLRPGARAIARRPVAGGDAQLVAVRLDESCLAVRRSAALDGHARAQQDQPPAVEKRERVRPRMQAADRGCACRSAGQRPVDDAVVPGQPMARRWPRASSCGVSCDGARCAMRSSVETSSAAPSRARSRSTSSLVSSGPIGRRTVGQHRPGVERLDDPHDRHAGFALAGDDRAMHRRGAAIAGQQRRVDVDHAEPRRGEHGVGEDLPVGGDDAESASSAASAVEEGRDPSAVSGCSTGRPRCERPRLDRRVGRLLAAAARPIRLRDDADDRDARDASSASSVGTANAGVPKNTTRSGARAHHLPARVSFRILRTMRSRLMPRSRSTNSVPSR